MNRHCNTGWFSFWQTLHIGILSIIDNASMLAISGDTELGGIVPESIATTDVPEELVDTADGPKVVPYSTLNKPDLELLRADFHCGA